jgi:hypothetical protein
MSAVLCTDATFSEDTRRCPFIEHDYRWAIRMGFFTHSEEAWSDWAKGYEAGEEIGRRAARRSRRMAH